MPDKRRQLSEVLGRFAELRSRDWQKIEESFIYREVPKGFRLVDEDQVADELYFIQKGCVRIIYNRDGDERTFFIFTEGLFTTSFQSFITRKPGEQILEALEPCELLVLSYDRLQQLYQQVPVMNVIIRQILEERFVNAQSMVASFILDTPEERYIKLEKNRPDLLQRVPQHVIASFLGVTPVSLSRIRKRITG